MIISYVYTIRKGVRLIYMQTFTPLMYVLTRYTTIPFVGQARIRNRVVQSYVLHTVGSYTRQHLAVLS